MNRVILQNVEKRPKGCLVLNLTKDTVPVRIETKTNEVSKDGDVRKRIATKTIPGSLRIRYLEKVEVPESWTRCPEVAAAINSRKLRVTKLQAPAQEIHTGSIRPRKKAK